MVGLGSSQIAHFKTTYNKADWEGKWLCFEVSVLVVLLGHCFSGERASFLFPKEKRGIETNGFKNPRSVAGAAAGYGTQKPEPAPKSEEPKRVASAHLMI
jgi:hypothetical protein